MKWNLLIAATCLPLIASCGSDDPASGGESSDASPNVSGGSDADAPKSLLLVTIDTLRADHVGCYGYPAASTPVMDSLADTGVRFESASAVAPITFPSHTSILTGTIPPFHGARDNASHRALPELVTLAEVLQAAGFHTGAFTAAFVLDPIYGLDQGFDFYGATPQLLPEPQSEFEERGAGAVNQEAIGWLAGLGDDKPFFMWVHYFEPHLPWPPADALPPRFKNKPYDAEIWAADTFLGQLLEQIERLGRRQETLVVLTSDHGESLNEHGEETHSYFAYEATLHVPLIFQHASLAMGTVVEERVSSVDIMPTVLEIFDLSPGDLPPPGASLAAQLHGETVPGRAVYFESLTPRLSYGWAPIQGVTKDDMKYIRVPRPELYALASDPSELKNVYESDPATAKQLEDTLTELLAQNDQPERAAAARRELTADERQKLENLGYVGTAGATGGEATLADPKDGIERLAREHQVRHELDHGDLHAAEVLLTQLLREDPKNPVLNAHFGLLMMKHRRHSEAIPSIQKSIKYGMDNATNYSNLGTCYFKIGAYKDAVNALEEALKQNSKHLLSLYWLGQTQAAMGRKADALASYEKILELWDGPLSGPKAGMVKQVRDLMALVK